MSGGLEMLHLLFESGFIDYAHAKRSQDLLEFEVLIHGVLQNRWSRRKIARRGDVRTLVTVELDCQTGWPCLRKRSYSGRVEVRRSRIRLGLG
jgi:hypothetical protein